MSLHTARIEWQRGPAEAFVDQRYSRRHTIAFDGGARIAASSSPSVVPLPWSDAAAVDPEELFVASLASCHMLWFLSLAAERGHCVERYADDAVGAMARNADGRLAIVRVTLRPEVWWSPPNIPDAAAVRALHAAAHDACFIAQSVRCDVACEPRIADAPDANSRMSPTAPPC